MRHACLLRRLADAPRDFIHYDVVVGGVAADKASEADDGVVFLRLGEGTCSGRNFERARDADKNNVFLVRARAEKTVERTLKEPFGDESVETGDDQREAFASGVEITLDCWES